MAIIANVPLPAGYDPQKAVTVYFVWPKGSKRDAENVMAVQVEIADDLLPVVDTNGKASKSQFGSHASWQGDNTRWAV